MGIHALNQGFSLRYDMLLEEWQVVIYLPAGMGSQCSMSAL